MHTDCNEPEFCIVCHAPNYADSTTNLSTTYDGVGQKSLQLKVIVHRIHTGGRRGSASLEAIQPVLTSTFFEGLFPNDLRNCTVCHEGKSYLVESVPEDAAPTVVNETADPSLNGLVRTPPVQAACLGCHATGATFAHVATKTVNGVETCPQCHGAKGSQADRGGARAPAGGGHRRVRVVLLHPPERPRARAAPRRACHAAGGAAPILEGSSAYAALVSAPSGQAPLASWRPRGRPGATSSRSCAATGSMMLMPTDGTLDDATIEAIEAWIATERRMTDRTARRAAPRAARLVAAALLCAAATAARAGSGVIVSGSVYVDHWGIQDKEIAARSPRSVT